MNTNSSLGLTAILNALTISASAITATFVPVQVFAQEASALEEIVVTARRRDERIEDVPISIAAFSGDDLADRQITNTDRLSEIAPNVQFSPVAPSSGNSSSSSIFIRGVGQTDFIASTDPGVGFYVDGVYFARASGTAVALLDVQHVEVLRGPQGTLFGRNTVGGAIQVISNKPTLNKIEGSVSVAVGRYNRHDETGILNLPLSDTLGLRVAVTKRDKDGYVTNVLNGRDMGGVDTLAGRVSLLWKPTNSFDLLWVNDYVSDDNNGAPTVFGGINTSANFVKIAAAAAGCPGFTFPPTPASPVPENNDPRCPNNQYLALGPYKVAAEAPTRSKLEMYGSALTLTGKLTDSMTLKSITAYRVTKPFSIRDADNTPQLILETVNQDDIKQFSQEFQLLGDAVDHRLHWQAGAYYFRETDNQFYPVYLPSILNGSGTETAVGGSNSAADIKNESYAFFTQETFDLTDRLNVTAGIRYTHDKKEATPHQFASPSVYGFTNVGYGVPNPVPTSSTCLGNAAAPPSRPCTGPTDTIFAQVLNSRADSKVTPMASLQYRWNPDLMTYASYSQGFKSGGFNTRIIQPVIGPNSPTGRELLPAFDPEKVTSFEIGAKAQIGGIARLSAAVFSSKYKDIQIVVREGVAPVVRNAGEATIDGVELEGLLAPTKNLDINFGFGYTHFKYDSFTAALEAGQTGLAVGAPGRVDLDDQQAYTPEMSATLGIVYRITTSVGTFAPRVDSSYRSKTYFDAPNTEEIAQPAYYIYGASVRYSDAKDRLSITGGATNLGDKAYKVSGNSSLTASSGYAEVVYAPPRQWFVEASFKF